ncbi:MAG: zinc ribbon domain-containing protein [Actinobacteria bacterium]|nr:zinc ribbon domain-containing protein [Actinomycetota bacterium]
MPVYEYACTVCGERTEAKQSFSDPPLKECPVCGGTLRKLYSPVGIVFKGSGFYSTDRNKARESAAVSKGEKAAATDGEKREGGKREGATDKAGASEASSGSSDSGSSAGPASGAKAKAPRKDS